MPIQRAGAHFPQLNCFASLLTQLRLRSSFPWIVYCFSQRILSIICWPVSGCLVKVKELVKKTFVHLVRLTSCHAIHKLGKFFNKLHKLRIRRVFLPREETGWLKTKPTRCSKYCHINCGCHALLTAHTHLTPPPPHLHINFGVHTQKKIRRSLVMSIYNLLELH